MDVLTGGPERVRPRRRWMTGVVAVAVAGLAAVLAARSTPHRPDADPPPPPPPTTAPAPVPPALAGVAVGTRYAYALVADCLGLTSTECGYALHRREFPGNRWFPMPLRLARRDTVGVPAQLWVTGADVVTVVQQPNTGMVYASTDGGDTVRSRPMHPGPPIDAVPPDGVLDPWLCDTCASRLTVLEPASAELRPLSTQPSFGTTAGVRTFASAGATIWVLAELGEGGYATAVSTDRGRSWRAVPVRGFPAGIDNLTVKVGPGGSAYLLGARATAGNSGPLAEIWRVDGPAGTWRRLVADRGPVAPVSALPLGSGLLLTDFRGSSWRVAPDGRVARIPDVQLAAARIGPGFVASGPAGVLVGMPIGDEVRNAVLVSTDHGDSWVVEQVAD